VERTRDRNIRIEDLNQLRLWMESKPNVPEGPWYKDFASFKLCGEGSYPKTFLRAGQPAIRTTALGNEGPAHEFGADPAGTTDDRSDLVNVLLRL
jgi:hypothetical protein